MNDQIIDMDAKQQAIKNIVIALSDNTDSIGLSSDRLDEICRSLNVIFEGQAKCKNVIYTVNTDKLPFGIYIDPKIGNYELVKILFEDTSTAVNEYSVEIDSKLFMEGLTPEDITKMLLHDVEIMISEDVMIKLKSLLDIYVVNTLDTINIKQSIAANSILIYAIKDTLNKLSSSIYSKYDFVFNTDEVIDKISKADYENISIFDNFPKVIILQWAFMVYQDIKTNYAIIKSTLEEAKDLTGSKLVKDTVDKAIAGLSRSGFDLIDESIDLCKFLDQKNIPLTEASIFKSLKTSGLRAIENDYYEYAILVKSASDENEAMFALRGINTRINILTDYIYNTPNISDAERRHWEGVVQMYQDLRIRLTKKNILNKKSYGLWFDYSKLDNLDRPSDDEY